MATRDYEIFDEGSSSLPEFLSYKISVRQNFILQPISTGNSNPTYTVVIVASTSAPILVAKRIAGRPTKSEAAARTRGRSQSPEPLNYSTFFYFYVLFFG